MIRGHQRKVWAALALTALVVLGASSAAEAATKLGVAGPALTITDGDANDGAPNPDTIVDHSTISPVSDGFQVKLADALPHSDLPQSATDVIFEFTTTDIDFEMLQLYITWAGNPAAGGYMDYAIDYGTGNLGFETTTLIGSLTALGTPLAGSTLPGAAPTMSPYSFTQVFTLHHGNAGGFSKVDMSAASIPEPALMSLLALGLAGAAALRHRRTAR